METVYELLTIWPGGEYVHFSTENKNAICEKYNRCREQEIPMRIRENGRILTIREADEMCGEKWPIVPQVVKRKKRVYGQKQIPNIKRKAVAEIDEDGTILRTFPSAEKMADAIGICWSAASEWARSGKMRETGCIYRYLEDMQNESNA